MPIVNLTPHDIHIYDAEGKNVIRTYPASGIIARVKSSTEIVGEVDGIAVARSVYGDIDGLPDPQEGVVYIVSLFVAQAAASSLGRGDLVSPDTSPGSAVRDGNGQIIGVRRFQTV